MKEHGSGIWMFIVEMHCVVKLCGQDDQTAISGNPRVSSALKVLTASAETIQIEKTRPSQAVLLLLDITRHSDSDKFYSTSSYKIGRKL